MTDLAKESASLTAPFLLGDWRVEPSTNRLHRDGREVRLEPKVMRVLIYLAGRRAEVVPRRELEAAVWRGMIVSDDAVTNTVIKLRKALGDDAREPRYIETIAKSGYRLIAPIAPIEQAADAAEPPREPPSEPPPADMPADTIASNDARATIAPRRPGFWLAGLALSAVALLAWLAFRPTATVPSDPLVERAAGPVVAVLPFENLTADPDQDYFADGITEDLITDLSKLSGLQVVARNSVFAYRDSAQPERQIGAQLGARFLVKGSVRRAGERLRIHVRLTDAVEGRNRWAERYDRRLADIFSIQDEIAARVVSALQVELAPGEQQRLTRRYAASVEAYDEFLRGLDLLGRRSGPDNTEAKVHFERAVELEPGFARAYAGLALTYAQDAVYSSGEKVGASLVKAEAVVRQAMAIDDRLPQSRYVVAMVELYKGNLAAAVAEISRAIELKPSYADGYGLLAWILHFAGRPAEGLEAMQRAIDLNPRVPALYRTVKAALHYELGELDPALQLLRESIDIGPNQVLARLFLAAVYAETGQLDAASWEIEEIHALDPGFTLADLDHGFPIRDPRYKERFVAQLRRAGLAE